MNLAIIVKKIFPFDWRVKRVFNKSLLIDKVVAVNNESKIDKNLKKYNLKYDDTITFHMPSKYSLTINRKIKEAVKNINDLIWAAIDCGSAVLGHRLQATAHIIDDEGKSEAVDKEKIYEIRNTQSIIYGLFKKYENDGLYRIDLLGLNTKVIDVNTRY